MALQTKSAIDYKNKNMKVEIKNDQEEKEILLKIYKHLTDAGYMRANFNGLSPFDKIAGGLTWCITGSDNLNNIGFLFGYGEELNIRKKILLSERIINALLRATKRCPIILQPHQIMGLDVDKLIIVIKWLISQNCKFGKTTTDHTQTLITLKLDETTRMVVSNIISVIEKYQPTRRYRQKVPLTSADNYKQTHHHYVFVNYKKTKNNKLILDERKDFIENKSAGIYPIDLDEIDKMIRDDDEARQEHYNLLKEELSVASPSETISAELSKLETYTKLSESLKSENINLMEIICRESTELENIQIANREYEAEVAAMEGQIKSKEDYQKVLDMVIETKNIRDQFSSLRSKHMEKHVQIEEEKSIIAEEDFTQQINYMKELNEKIIEMESRLAEEDEEIKELEHLLDQPGPAELAMYQRRFLELYDQISANTIETKQFYDFYNTLIDSKQYIEKEVNLLNSVLDNYSRAMSAANFREQFFNQLESIVEWVTQTKNKLNIIQNTKKEVRQSLYQQLSSLMELEREYATVVSQLNSEASPEKRLKNFHLFEDY